ncbi:MAG: sigma-E processing peptidase SpoIIGA [Oscillospiraceae bacterium]|nr:sigma-E processing peptidase SpoIIGA [Oscillospiraceae bacterium]
MQVLYLDTLFLLNLLADYLLCLSAGRICGLRLRRRRYLLAALLGSVYAVAVYLPGLAFLAAAPFRLLAGLAMGLVAYGGERQRIRCIGVFLLTSAAFGGALCALSLAAGGDGSLPPLSFRSLLLAFALCYGAFRLLFRRRSRSLEQRHVPVQVSFLGRETAFTALVDSGNSLSDPLSGDRVLIACPHALKPLLRENTLLFEQLDTASLLEYAARTPELRGRLRPLSCQSLGGGSLLPVFRPDRVRIAGRDQPGLLIAVSPRAVGEDFEALF